MHAIKNYEHHEQELDPEETPSSDPSAESQVQLVEMNDSEEKTNLI